MGGFDPATDAPLHDVWQMSLATGEWTELTLSTPPVGRVLAATYHFPDQGLCWVDERVVGAHSERRLVRAHLDTGESVVLARWTSLGKGGKLFLQSDQGGRFLLLAATSGKGMGAHVIVRLDVSGAGAPSVAGLHLGPHPLLLGPLVDPAGYSVVVRRQGRARLERAPRLEALEGVWLSGVGKTLHDCVE